MKRLLLTVLTVGLAASVGAAFPIIGYVQLNPPNGTQLGEFNTSSGTVGSLTDTGLSSGGCVQAAIGGSLTTTGVNCGSGGGGGSIGGTINTAPQYSPSYYAIASSNVLSGLSPGTSGQILTTQGSSGPPFWGPIPLSASSATVTYVQISSSGNFILNGTANQSATFNVTSGTINGPFNASTIESLNGYTQNNLTVLTSSRVSSFTAVGTGALNSLSGGIENVAVGNNALNANSLGNVNTAVGFKALQSNIGSFNTGVGANSLFFNTVGQGNVAAGDNTLVTNVGGSFNSAFGSGALGSSGSSDNTGLGYGSLFSTTGGSDNTAIGYLSGSTNTGGSNNIFIGSGANAASNSLTNAIAIGFNSSVSASNTAQIGGAVNSSTAINLTVASMTISGLQAGQCVQAGTGGLLTATGSACGASGGGGSGIINAASQDVIPFYSTTGSSNVVSGATSITTDGVGQLTVSTITGIAGNYGSSSATNGPAGSNAFHGSYVAIRSSGTTAGLLIDSRGIVAGGAQQQVGALTVRNDANPGSPASTLLVLVDSTTDSQSGTGELEIWSNGAMHNDPIIWIHRASSNSSPEMRWDSPSPNMEMVTTSTDNAHGRGKWEPYANASADIYLQVNSRAWDNTTFENVAYWAPLDIQPSLGLPGLYLRAQDLTDDSGVLTSSVTAAVNFFTLNGHTVGLQGPANTTASWAFQIPHTFQNQGQLLYQTTNSSPWNWEFTTGGSSQQVLTNGGTGAPYWSTVSGGAIISTNTLQFGTTFYVSSGTIGQGNFYVNSDPTLAVAPFPSTGTITINTPSQSTTAGSINYKVQTGTILPNFSLIVSSASNASLTMSLKGSGSIGGCTAGLSWGGVCLSQIGGISTMNTSLSISGGIYIKGQDNQNNATYLVTSTDTVILASATNNAGMTINLPASSSSLGQLLTISKVDQSTQAVTIQANGTDVIAGTGTLNLNAFMQTDSIVSDGIGHWLPYGHGISPTPPIFINAYGASAASAVATSSAIYSQAFYVPIPVNVRAFRLAATATTSNVDLGIYDQNYKLLGNTGSLATINGEATYNLLTPLNLAPGYYYMAFTASNVLGTSTFQRLAGNASQQNCNVDTSDAALPLPSAPNPNNFGTTALCFLQAVLVNGGVSQ